MSSESYQHVPVGSESTRLITLRGNSGSGKSAIAGEICGRHGYGISLVSQDILRLVVLREREAPDGPSTALMDAVARYALGRGFHVIIEGILPAAHCATMLTSLYRDHRGVSRLYYLDVPFEETLRRHATRAAATEFGRNEMQRWYRESDLLPGGIEEIIPAASSLEETVSQIMDSAALASSAEHHPYPRYKMVRMSLLLSSMNNHVSEFDDARDYRTRNAPGRRFQVYENVPRIDRQP